MPADPVPPRPARERIGSGVRVVREGCACCVPAVLLTTAVLAGGRRSAAAAPVVRDAPAAPGRSTTARHADSRLPVGGDPGSTSSTTACTCAGSRASGTLVGVATGPAGPGAGRPLPARPVGPARRLAARGDRPPHRASGGATSGTPVGTCDVSAPGMVAGVDVRRGDLVPRAPGAHGGAVEPRRHGRRSAGRPRGTARPGRCRSRTARSRGTPSTTSPSDKATYRTSRLDVPRRWVGVSNGRLDSRRVAHGRTLTHFSNRDPMASYLMTVAIGPYVRSTQTGPHGLPLTYWVPRGHPELPRPAALDPGRAALAGGPARALPVRPRRGRGDTVGLRDGDPDAGHVRRAELPLRQPRRPPDRRPRARARVVRRHGHARRLVATCG